MSGSNIANISGYLESIMESGYCSVLSPQEWHMPGQGCPNAGQQGLAVGESCDRPLWSLRFGSQSSQANKSHPSSFAFCVAGDEVTGAVCWKSEADQQQKVLLTSPYLHGV